MTTATRILKMEMKRIWAVLDMVAPFEVQVHK
jgi:hypothetical protein